MLPARPLTGNGSGHRCCGYEARNTRTIRGGARTDSADSAPNPLTSDWAADEERQSVAAERYASWTTCITTRPSSPLGRGCRPLASESRNSAIWAVYIGCSASSMWPCSGRAARSARSRGCRRPPCPPPCRPRSAATTPTPRLNGCRWTTRSTQCRRRHSGRRCSGSPLPHERAPASDRPAGISPCRSRARPCRAARLWVPERRSWMLSCEFATSVAGPR